MSKPRILFALLAVLALPAAIPAQQSISDDPVVRERVEVDLVDLQVVVTDAKGNPIEGLTEDAFKITEDGKKVKISNFAEIGRPATVAGETPASEDAPGASAGAATLDGGDDGPLHVVVYVDAWNIHPLRRNQVLERIHGFFESEATPDVPVMLVSSAPEVRVVQPFTRDLAALEAAADELMRTTPPGMFGQGTRDEQLDDVNRSVQTVLDCVRQPSCDGNLLENTVRATVDQIRDVSRQLTIRSEASLEGLRLVCAALARMPGRKSVLYVSDGFPLEAGNSMIRGFREKISFALGAGFSGADTGSLSGGDPNRTDRLRRQMLDAIDTQYSDTSAYNLSQALERVAAEATTNHIRVYSIHAEGLDSGMPDAERSGKEVIAEMATPVPFLGPQAMRAPLELMAGSTGGLVLSGGIRTEEMLSRVIVESERYYSIAYRMPKKPDGEFRKLKIKVDAGRGARVRAPSGYVAKTSEQRRGDAVLATFTIPPEDQSGSVGLQFAETRTDDDGRQVVQTTVLVPIAEMQLQPRGGNHETSLKLFVAARTAQGRFSLMREFPVEVRIPSQHVEAARSQSFPVRLDVLVTEGENQVAVGVWDDNGPLRAFARGAMVVP